MIGWNVSPSLTCHSTLSTPHKRSKHKRNGSQPAVTQHGKYALAFKLVEHLREEGYAGEDRFGVPFPEQVGSLLDLSDNVPTVIERRRVFG